MHLTLALSAVLSMSVLTAFSHARAASAPPASMLFQNAQLAGATIAPDGKHVLVLKTPPGQRTRLMLLDLATMQMSMLAGYADGDVQMAFWLSDKRVVFRVGNVVPGVIVTTAGLFAMDIDGKDKIMVGDALIGKRSFAGSGTTSAPPARGANEVRGRLPSDSDQMLMLVGSQDDDAADLHSLDTRSERMTEKRAPARTRTWLVDDKGEVRLAIARTAGADTLTFLAADGTWRKLATIPDPADPVIDPALYFDNVLYVHARNGGDKTQLLRYSVERNALELPAMVVSPDYDLNGDVITDGKKVLGYHYLGEAFETVWFDRSMAALQADIDSLFPTTANRIARPVRPATPYILVSSKSPQQPEVIRLYNSETRKATLVGSALPEVEAARMAPTAMKRYKARDGLLIPAYLTLPAAAPATRLPTVILVKPSSWSRHGHWDYDPEVQFLAARGYAVIQPETRGTAGFGQAHFKAGRKQWGLAMQDDLADAARWAIAEGIADPARICIAGTGYGGYAALMGLVKDAAIFRCGVSWAGIVDIGLMFKNDWNGAGTTLPLTAVVGDPVLDKAQFVATSPLHNAKRIVNPVFLAYGAQDELVPGKHGRLLYDALKAGNPAAEFHWFDDKGQSWSLEKNRAELWTGIGKFLDKHIGKR